MTIAELWKEIMNKDVEWVIYFILGMTAQEIITGFDWYFSLPLFWICVLISWTIWELI